MSIQAYNIQRQNTRSTFNGVKFLLPFDAEFDLTGAVVRINFERKGKNITELSMSTTNGKISLELPYTIVLNEQKILLPAATYEWDCKIIFANGIEKTYIGGEWIIDDIIT